MRPSGCSANTVPTKGCQPKPAIERDVVVLAKQQAEIDVVVARQRSDRRFHPGAGEAQSALWFRGRNPADPADPHDPAIPVAAADEEPDVADQFTIMCDQDPEVGMRGRKAAPSQ